jgi:DNA-binding NarL/FixJ family response regulator
MIRVVIVDDEALVRTGFTMILNATEDIRVVGTAAGIDALDVIRVEKPDVLLLDIRMPQVDGLTLLSVVDTLPDRPAIAMLTTFDADEYVMAALGSGASGFLLKDTEPEQLAQYVRALAAGGVVLSARASRTLLDSHPGLGRTVDAEADRVSTLTDRERQVLTLVAHGLSNAEIAGRLYLGSGTVKDHVSAILAKLGVGSRVQAALAAQRAGLLDDRTVES